MAHTSIVFVQQFPGGREQAEERPRRRGKAGSAQMSRCLVVGRRHNRGEKMSGGSGGARRAGERLRKPTHGAARGWGAKHDE